MSAVILRVLAIVFPVALLFSGIVFTIGGWDEMRLVHANVESSCSVRDSGVSGSKSNYTPYVVLVHEHDGKRHERREVGATRDRDERRQPLPSFASGRRCGAATSQAVRIWSRCSKIAKTPTPG